MVARVILSLVGGVSLAILIVLGALLGRVAALEARELDVRGVTVSLEPTEGRAIELAEATLERGEGAIFELCSDDELGEAWGDRVRVELARGDETISTLTLDGPTRALARRSARGACVEVGRGTLEAGGVYRVAITVDPPAPPARVRARILARRDFGPRERNLALALLGLGVTLVILLAARDPSVRATWPRWLRGASARARRRARRHRLAFAVALVAAGVLAVVAVGIALPALTPGGSTFGLVAGLVLAAFELLLAWTLIGGSAARLGLARPSSWVGTLGAFVAAPLVGLALFRFAYFALSSIEPSGEAPIEAFVAWPSGRLSFAALALVAPIAEEVFFRGFVFGAIDDGRWGRRRALAFVLASGLFALAHVAQGWGNWGGLLAVAVAGIAFTLLRMLSGSTLVAALAHLVYNALLSISALTS